ncbi:MAG: FtsW/RodA/SpoVE family cell cycle protein [Candidatus Ventricola sp.]
MARRQQVYTARVKRADDGAQDAKIKKKRTGEPEDGALPAKTRPRRETAAPEKDAAARRASKTAAARLEADDALKKRTAAKATAGKPVSKAAKSAPRRRQSDSPAARRRAKEKARVSAMGRDRKRQLARGGGFAVWLIALLTAAFDVLGLLLCAVRTQGVIDTQALVMLAVMAPLALLTATVLPRIAPVDPLLMALTNFLCGVSVVILYTVSPERGIRQMVFYVAGLAVLLAAAWFVSRVRRWHGFTLLAMVLGIGALVLPLAFGEWNYGAKNWVSLPVIGSFQPSELVKLALVLAMAYYFSAHRTVWQMMPALVFAAACLVLLMLQRDLGTALIYYLTTLALFYVACGNLPLTAVGLGGGVAAAVLGYRMFAHVKVRVAMWQNPWSDALDKGYQIIQALLAIGSGGLFGVGLGQGTPEKIPAYYNDFIFAVVCEQLGIVFGICVIAVYVLILLRGMEVSMRARRSFDMLLGCGVVALLGVQTFMIVAGVIKMIPLTGVTMPFLSYGGSSLLSCMAMMGMLCGISGRVREETEEDILSVRG